MSAMDSRPTLSLTEAARVCAATLRGDGERRVCGIAPLASAGPAEVSFMARADFAAQLPNTRAAAVLLTSAHVDDCPVDALVTDNPYLAYAKLSQHFERRPFGIHPSAQIHPSARIARNVAIGAGSVIGVDCEIGADSCVFANVTIADNVRIGARARVQSGTVIGADGFGYAPANAADPPWVRIAQLGGVRIGDDVDIGANVAIDRGALEDTVISDGVKIDNLVHIAHNVRVGEHTAIAAGTGIAGGVVIGARCRFAGMCGVAGHVRIVDDVSVTGMGMVAQSVTEPGVYSSGVVLMPNRDWLRNTSRFKRLDSLYRQVQKLVQRQRKDEL